MSRNFALIVTPILVLAALWIAFGNFEGAAPSAQSPQGRQPRYAMTGAEWTRYDADGRASLHATADTIRYYDDKSAELEDLQVDQLGPEHGPWRLTAPRGHAPANEQRLQLEPPVIMRGALEPDEPLELTLDSLWVDYARRELYTDSPVQVTAPNREVRARGLRADWAGTRLQLLKDVEVHYATRS